MSTARTDPGPGAAPEAPDATAAPDGVPNGLPRTVSSRLLSVLAAFDADHHRLTLSQLAARSGLPLATAHRLVGELQRWGALRRDADGSYRIGRRLWDLGLLAAVHRDLRELAVPYLQDLHSLTGETVHVAIRDGLCALYIERVAARGPLPPRNRSGSRVPLHAVASGKVLLAWSPAEVRRQALAAPVRITRHTVTEPGRLQRELLDVRRRGFARAAEELAAGAWSVAVPVRGRDGEVVAALGAVATSPRRDLVRLVPALQVAANGIGRELPPGWNGG